MTEQHPIILDSKTIHRLSNGYFDPRQEGVLYDSLNRIAQWGADCELEKCCEWLDAACLHLDGSYLRSDRRPKPPSLKEQALAELEKVDMLWDTTEFGRETLNSLDTIRRALEALDD